MHEETFHPKQPSTAAMHHSSAQFTTQLLADLSYQALANFESFESGWMEVMLRSS
jgi:hypothetical protein